MSTHTYAVLEVSRATFDEIAKKLMRRDRTDVFSGEGGTLMDMHGLALSREGAAQRVKRPCADFRAVDVVEAQIDRTGDPTALCQCGFSRACHKGAAPTVQDAAEAVLGSDAEVVDVEDG